MELEKQIEILKEWHKGAEMSLPIMSSDDIERFLHWLEDYKKLKADYIELDRRLRTANTEIDRLRNASSWIPCSESMPEYPCIVADANGNTPRVPDGIAVFRDEKGNTMAFDRKIVFEYKEQFYSKRGSFPLLCEENRITHWMPLPEPPKGESK